MQSRPLEADAVRLAVQEVPQLGHIRELAKQWQWALRAQALSRHTITSYENSVRFFTEFLEENGMPVLVSAITRDHFEAWITHLLETRSAATARVRFQALTQFWRFCEEEGEITKDPSKNMRAPKVIPPRVEVLTAEDRRKLLKACEGKTFEDRRDMAVIRLLLDSGLRRGELCALVVDDVDLDPVIPSVLVRAGKGGRSRKVPFSAQTALALSRYLSVRARHRWAALPQFFLAAPGPLSWSAMAHLLTKRAKMAGLGHLHPHQLRHSFADRWRRAGGSDGDLMTLAGW